MRILKITQSYYPFLDRGGPAIKVRSIARGLVELGHQVTVLTADLGFGTRELEMSAAVRGPRGWRTELDGVDTIYLTTRFKYRGLTVNPGVLRFCETQMRQFEVIHIYGLYDTLGPIVGWYCRKYRKPYVVEPLGMTRPIDRAFFLKKLWKGLAAGYLSNARAIITTSELERSELLAEGFPTAQVLLRYNGIDLAEFRALPVPGSCRQRLGLRSDDRLVLFLGRIIPRKGADLLIEALSQISDQSLKLVIAGPEGEAGYLDFLRGKARDLNIADRVLFVGPLYADDKKAALVDAFAFALPSRYENFGNSAAEAVACGTPAIVSDRCGIAPLIDGRAGLVTAYDSSSIAQAINMLLGNPEIYRKLKTGCRQVAEEISWDKLIGDLERSYRGLPPHSQLQPVLAH